MKRSLKFGLASSNRGKLDGLAQLAREYKETVNYFLKRLLAQKSLSEEFLKSYHSPLSYRYKQCAKRQAFKIFKCWCRNKKKGEKPKLKNFSLILDYRFLELQKSKNSNSFDYWLKIATPCQARREMVFDFNL